MECSVPSRRCFPIWNFSSSLLVRRYSVPRFEPQMKRVHSMVTSSSKDDVSWNDVTNRRKYLSELATLLGFEQMEDWYKVKLSDFSSHKGENLLLSFENSPFKLLKSSFPEYDWKPWNFLQTSKEVWDDINIQQEYLKDLASKLGFTSMEDWYKIKQHDFLKTMEGNLLQFTVVHQ